MAPCCSSPAADLTMRSFDDRTVVITGGSGGLGRALAEMAGAAGARIALLDIDRQALEEAQQQLQSRGVQALGLVCDVADLDACLNAMTRIRETFGPIDVLVNNAGIAHRSLFAATAPAVIHKVMSINFNGALHCTHAALPDLLARRGQIIVISSVAGFAPLIGRTGYAASKHALHGFFDSLRSEVAPQGVHVMIVGPSFIATGIDSRALGGDGNRLTRAKPLSGKPALPLEIARAICRAACAERDLLLPGMASKISWWLSRLAPRRYARLMAQRLGSEFDIDPSA